MNEQTAAPLTAAERFQADNIGAALQDVGLFLAILDCRLPADEFLRLARPFYSDLVALRAELERLAVEQAGSLWAPYTHKQRGAPDSWPERQDEQEEADNRRCFEIALDSLRECLETAAPLFERAPATALR